MRGKFVLLYSIILFQFIIWNISFGAKIHFGIQFQATETYNMPPSVKSQLVHALGFNYCFVGGDTTYGVTENQLSAFRDSGLAVVPGMGGSDWPAVLDAYKAYMNAHYMVMQAEDSTSEVCFLTRHGMADSSGQWYEARDSIVNDTARAFILLDDLYYDNERSSLRDTVKYVPFIRMRVDVDSVPSGDTLAYLRVWGIDSTDQWGSINEIVRHNRLIKEYLILSNSFRDSFPNPNGIEFLPSFTIPDTIYRYTLDSLGSIIKVDTSLGISNMVLTYQIVSTGILPFAVDSFAVYNGDGLDIASGRYNNAFNSYISSHQNVLAYQLRDDMPYDMMLPAKHLDQLIKGNSSTCGMWKPWLAGFKWPYNYASGFGGKIPPREFFKIAQPKRFWINSYPFWDNYCSDNVWNGKRTLYYGYSYEDCNEGLQTAMDSLVTNPLDSLIAIMPDTIELWYTAQAQTEKYNGSEGFTHRRPTGPEMSMEAFIALSYGIKAIQYWPYITYSDGYKTYSGLDKYPLQGNNWLDTTEAWHNIHAYVTPNLQALSGYLADSNMVWEGSYSSHQPERFHYVSDIHGWSDSPNPDSGWAQIGEFHNGSDKYILLVNRACNIDSATEAPPQHFVLRLNPANLNFGDHIYIIDLAHSARHASGDSGWVGNQDTTYSSTMSDGYIPFTTTLKAGEGRLFKIVQAPAGPARFYDNLFSTAPQSAGFTYQGLINMPGDATVPAGATLKVKAPVLFRIAHCDSLHAGLDFNRAELICNGRLNLRGTPKDTVKFNVTYDCGTGNENTNPQPGYWYGIRDRSSGADTLACCLIKYTYEGFRADTNSNALLSHCQISRSYDCGIRLFNTGLSETVIDSSVITDNENMGIYAEFSLLTASGNVFTKNKYYGIQIKKKPATSGVHQYTLTGNALTAGTGYTSAYGISIEGVGASYPEAVLSGNSVKHFTQPGINLSYTTAGQWIGSTGGVQFTGNNVVDSNGTYGLYCYNSSPAIFSDDECSVANSFSYNASYGIYCTVSSSPKISKNQFTENKVSNVKCTSTSYPNLGDSVNFWGYNLFKTYSSPNSYDIYNSNGNTIQIFAKNNWWGEILQGDIPDTTDFYPNNRLVFRPYIHQHPCNQGQGKLAGNGEIFIPVSFALHQNYPNPFNPTTNIAFDLPQLSKVRLCIFNVLGQRIRTLADADYPAGCHEIIWDGRNDHGSEVSTGVYFYLLETENFRDAKKMVILK